MPSIQAVLSKGPDAPERTLYTLYHQPWVNFTIDFHGSVVGCCRDLRSEYVLGNLLEQSADAIWNGERMLNLRRALIEKRPQEIGICKACDVPGKGRTPAGLPWRRSGTSSSPAPGADSIGDDGPVCTEVAYCECRHPGLAGTMPPGRDRRCFGLQQRRTASVRRHGPDLGIRAGR